jgi:hypothetical protein
MDWLKKPRHERSLWRAEKEATSPPRTSGHRGCSNGKEAGVEDIVPAPFPPLNEIRDHRRQAAHRAQPGPCARRTAVESRDASSRDQKVHGVDAESDDEAEAEGLALAPITPGS